MDITFLFYSHSDYYDLWGSMKDSLAYIPDTCLRFIAINENSPTEPTGFDGILTYDDSLNYSDKVLVLLSQIKTTYVVFIHDNDLLMTFSNENFSDLLDIVQLNNIDRCMFGMIGYKNASIVHKDFGLVSSKDTKSHHFRTPYDVGPSIWKVQSFKNAMQSIPSTSYKDIEDSEIQTYCKNHLNVYGFSSSETHRAFYGLGRPFPKPFQFLHILFDDKLFLPHVYMDQTTNFIRIIMKYSVITKRETHPGTYPIAIKFRTV
jgi:hypothetical protein